MFDANLRILLVFIDIYCNNYTLLLKILFGLRIEVNFSELELNLFSLNKV